MIEVNVVFVLLGWIVNVSQTNKHYHNVNEISSYFI